MTQSKALMRSGWVLLAVCVVIGGFATSSFAYDVDAQFLDQYAMIFPVGDLIPEGGFNNASDINFQDMQPLFSLSVEQGNGGPAEMKFLIRLEIAGGGTIFTVSSRPFQVSRIIALGSQDNRQLASAPFIGVGQGDDINANDMLEYIDGGNMVDNLYVLTVLLATSDKGTGDWDAALAEAQTPGNGGEGYGVSSATMRVRNPSQVELTSPDARASVEGNPVFSWNFPRNPGVRFRLLVAEMEDPVGDPSTALDFANEQTTMLDKTYNANGFGELTIYAYQGIGEERALSEGATYAWRVTAFAPTMFPGVNSRIESTPRRFTYGVPLPEGFTATAPQGDIGDETRPTFEWEFPEVPNISFSLNIRDDNGEFATIPLTTLSPGLTNSGDQWSYRYLSGFNDRVLRGGDYTFDVTAIKRIGGEDRTVTSNELSFTYTPPPNEITARLPNGRWNPRNLNNFLQFVWGFQGQFDPEYFVLTVYGTNGGQIMQFDDIRGDQRRKVLSFQNLLQQLGADAIIQIAAVGVNFAWQIEAYDDEDDLIGQSQRVAFFSQRSDIVFDEPEGDIFNRTPTFRWHLEPPPPPGVELKFRLRIGAGGNLIHRATNLTQTSYTPQEQLNFTPNQPVNWRVGYSYIASRNAGWYNEVEPRAFTYVYNPPEPTLDRPADGTTVVTNTPTFDWSFPNDIDAVLTGFSVTVDGSEVASDLGANVRTYTMDAQNWDAGSEHSWTVTAYFEGDLQPTVATSRSFTYEGVNPDELTVTLLNPDNDGTLDTRTPTFEWEFPDLPNGWSAEFTVMITPTGGQERQVAVGSELSWVYEGAPALRPVAYQWSVVATVTSPANQQSIIASDTRTFTYVEPEEAGEGPEEGSPAATLVQTIRANLPVDMAEVATAPFMEAGWSLGEIRIDGTAVSVDAANQALGLEGNTFVGVFVSGQ